MNTLDDYGFRHELKFEMNAKMAEILKQKLKLLLSYDSFSKESDGSYYIRSLYFDDIYDTAYYEKINGIEEREKYRIRFYNFDLSYIVLELKGKKGAVSYKIQNQITYEEYIYIIQQEYDKIIIGDRSMLERFILDRKMKNLVPSVIVDYERIAFTYPSIGVRLTFDFAITSGKYNYDFFNKDIMLYDILEKDKIIFEVKYNKILPKWLKELIQSVPMTRISMSKFALCKELKGNVVQ